MRSERGAVPALLVVLALVAAFAVVAFLLLTGGGADGLDPNDGAALAMSEEDVAASTPDLDRAAATERETTESELLPEETAEETPAEDPDAIPPDATGLTGTIIDGDGRPAAGVTVTVSRTVSRRQSEEFGIDVEEGETNARFERVVETDETGRFTVIELIAKDGYRVEVETDAGRIGRKQGIQVIEKLVFDVGDVPLRAGARIRGRVRTEGGGPVAGARVRFGWDWGSDPIVTDEDGRFDAGVVFPGRHQIRVSAAGYALSDNVQREFVEGDDVDDLELVVVRAAPLRGRIVDEVGRGIGGAWVNANRQGRTMFSWFHDQTVSAEDGSFAFESIPAGEYDLNAAKQGYRQTNEGDVTAGGPPIELKLKRAGSVEGVVLDAATGAPVKAERIRLLWIPPWRRDDPNASLEDYYGEAPADCEEDGSFSIGLDDGGSFVAEAYADGYAPGRSERFELEENGTVTGVVVRVPRGLTLPLKTIDAATGAPVARAVVDVHVEVEEGENGGHTVRLASLGYAGGDFVNFAHSSGSSLGERVARRVTDEGGEAECASIFPGRFVVKATAPGYAPARVEGVVVARGTTPATVEVSFSHGGTITGRVTSDRGAAEPALRVHATNSDGRAGEAVTGEGGAYRLENLAPGRYAVEAENPDATGRSRGVFGQGGNGGGNAQSEAEKFPLVVEEGGTVTKDLVIERVDPGVLGGTVLVNGTPRADVRVMANFVQEDGQTSWDWGNAARTDELGTFRFRRLKPGRYDLMVHESWSEMYEGGRANVTSGAESLITIDIGLGAITGRVVDADGRPLADVSVRAQRQRDESRRFFFGGSKQARTADDGTFRIEGLQEGAYDLQLHHRGHVSRSEEGVVVHPRRETAHGSIELATGGWIRLTVVGGREGERFRVSGQIPGSNRRRSQWVRLDAQGMAWVEVGDHEGSGELTVTERGPNGRAATVPVTLAKGAVGEATARFD